MTEPSFIEVQLPISKLSKESYKERKAVQSQTLTGLGKWWGRKPLILVRAAILGLLMPSSKNPDRDREIFLKILMMDENGLNARKSKNLGAKDIASYLTGAEKRKFFERDSSGEPKLKFPRGMTREDREKVESLAWGRMTYDQKLVYCRRPEEIELTDIAQWQEINAYLGTEAHSLQELFRQLGIKRFGHPAVVGDCFCGGGSIPYEAARCGCDVYASDLNPVSGLLTKAGLLLGRMTSAESEELECFQRRVFHAVDQKVRAMGVETNEAGDRGNIYLYCTELTCPECSWDIPVASSWVVGVGSRTVAILHENPTEQNFFIEIQSGVDDAVLAHAKESATVSGEYIHCPHCHRQTPTKYIRRLGRAENAGLRRWQQHEFRPRPNDVLRERLYCIRYERTTSDAKGNLQTERYYQAPDTHDLHREQIVEGFLTEHIVAWQEKGYIPSGEIIDGDETARLYREKGWKYWHQLFLPRQLLLHGLLLETIDTMAENDLQRMIGLLSINRCANWNSKLCGWGVGQARESMAQTFYNQALNTLWEETARGLSMLAGDYQIPLARVRFPRATDVSAEIVLSDARSMTRICDLWMTDPPYADAVNYHELSEFFLAWDKKQLAQLFPHSYTDSKRVLAVRGRDDDFNRAMIDIYKNMAAHMPDDGMQIIMFTHQDVGVWADLALVVWSAGLQVTAAWNIITETDASGLKNGNYVKGTVLLVLRKQKGAETAYLDELQPDIEDEVKRQVRSMQELDDKEEPNFSDADYILAAYAAALKVLTSVRKIEDVDVNYELTRRRTEGGTSPVVQLIEAAKKIAYDQLIPRAFDHFIWRMMEPVERFYIKGLEAEMNGVYQMAAYQELARGFGIVDYKSLMKETKANAARLRSGAEWGRRGLESDGFGRSLLRKILMSLYIATKNEESTPYEAKAYLRAEVGDYWNQRGRIQEILQFIAICSQLGNMQHWHKEANAARVLKELVATDGI